MVSGRLTPALHSAPSCGYLRKPFPAAAAAPLTGFDEVPNVIVRRGLRWLSERRGVFNFVRRNGLARRFASRFVAGETIEQAVDAAKVLTQRGITASLDLLGESVTAEAEATAARDQY